MPDLDFVPFRWVELRVFGPRLGCAATGFRSFWTVHPCKDGRVGGAIRNRRGDVVTFASVAEAEERIDDVHKGRTRHAVPRGVEFGGFRFRRSRVREFDRKEVDTRAEVCEE